MTTIFSPEVIGVVIATCVVKIAMDTGDIKSARHAFSTAMASIIAGLIGGSAVAEYLSLAERMTIFAHFMSTLTGDHLMRWAMRSASDPTRVIDWWRYGYGRRQSKKSSADEVSSDDP